MDQIEFIQLISPFKDKLYRMAKRLLVSSEEAEDATQEILIRLWTKKEKIKEYRSTEAFAMTMTKNLCLDRLKSKQASNLSLVHSNYQDAQASPQRQLEGQDSVAWVGKIMESLPEQQRMVLQLRDVEEYDYDEIADITGIKQATIRVLLSRARKTVRQELLKKHQYGIA